MPTSGLRHSTFTTRPTDLSFLAGVGPEALPGINNGISHMDEVLVVSAYGGAGNITWGAANLALYLPMIVSRRVTLTSTYVMVGGGGGTDSYDIGIYNEAFSKLASTGATLTVASTLQEAALTASVTLLPGRYYAAIAANGTTASSFIGNVPGSVREVRLYGGAQEASAYTLPATATPAAVSTQSRVPFMGFL